MILADGPSPNSTYIPCGGVGSINPENSTDLLPVDYWDCGRQYGQYYSTNLGVNLKPSLRNIVLVLSLLATTVLCTSQDITNQLNAIDGVWHDSGTNLTYTDLPLYNFLQNVAPIASENNLSIINTTSEVILSDIVPVSNTSSKVNIFKRDVVCTFYTWKQTQAAQKGEWWSPWYPVSCCIWDGKGDGADYTIDYEWSYSWSIDSGSSIGFKGISAAFPSYSLSKTYTHKNSLTCHIQGDVGQVWYQQHMVWADMQEQTCCFQAGNRGIWCGAWSKYYRTNAPIKGSYAVGCSVGKENTDCNAKDLVCAYNK